MRKLSEIWSNDSKHTQTLFSTATATGFRKFLLDVGTQSSIVEAGALTFLHLPGHTHASGRTANTTRSTRTMETVMTNLSKFTALNLGIRQTGSGMRRSFADTSIAWLGWHNFEGFWVYGGSTFLFVLHAMPLCHSFQGAAVGDPKPDLGHTSVQFVVDNPPRVSRVEQTDPRTFQTFQPRMELGAKVIQVHLYILYTQRWGQRWVNTFSTTSEIFGCAWWHCSAGCPLMVVSMYKEPNRPFI